MFPNAPGTQSLRFRGPTTASSDAANASEKLKTGAGKKVIKDTLIREQLNRFCGAMYTAISDCDETYNYWEPLHYLIHGHGFQTWEYSPQFSIRSWAYILIHTFPAWIASKVFTLDKRPGFFAIRAAFALISSYCEAKLYRAIADHINLRAARYFLAISLFSAGMWNASTAFLPSTFALHAITLAYSYILEPVSSKPEASKRTFNAVFCLATAVILGWPFVGVLALPFVFEELSMSGEDEIMPASRPVWAMRRFQRLFNSGIMALVLIALPVFLIDSLAYGQLVFVPLKIILYNVFPTQGSGPELYGVEPWYYYFLSLGLNFNIVSILALVSLPCLWLTKTFSPTVGLRLGTRLRHAHQSTASDLLLIRLAPVYIWIAILSQQPHKEERFMYPIYTLISFNAAVTLSLVRGWFEDAFVKATASPYRAGRTSLFGLFTRSILAITIFISAARIFAIQRYYHTPLDIVFHFQYNELPVRAIQSYPSFYQNLKLNTSLPILEALEFAEETVDLSVLKNERLNVCLGSEWYRFPNRFLIPNEIDVKFIDGGFKGQLPGRFLNDEDEQLKKIKLSQDEMALDRFWPWLGTRMNGSSFNSLNLPESDRLVDVEKCDYVITLLNDEILKQESKEWGEICKCEKILDNPRSNWLSRLIWIPFVKVFDDLQDGGLNKFSKLCLIKKKSLVGSSD
ncbi:family 22 glycosyltransferase [Melampsora larici-populina 98AG31]|uniref:Mannosyltransferase n=1 Tax=Melampsora larici-populina (strain 98AG31 / pathotype 3-4-7) TaxID=747676 RepID=F4S7Y5_MELLP|nr:family 22 glycosyltransferase [Melampsora larici-populina 98AG31]EGF99246.1 family 22 glycosyltransferase [Melampsora larici-populina 98AG31]